MHQLRWVRKGTDHIRRALNAGCMIQVDAAMIQAITVPPRPRHTVGGARRLPLFVWPVVAMLAMFPVLVVLIVLLVT
jgi:hypothetical protein